MLFKDKQELNKGQALIISVIFFLVVSLVLIFGIVTPVTKGAKITRDVLHSRSSYFIAEAGLEDVMYRIKTGQTVSLSETLSLDGNSAVTVTTNIGLNEKEILSVGDSENRIRRVKSYLKLASGSGNFNFGVQTDKGGFLLENSSEINGNLYSNGPIIGASGSTQSKIKGDAISSGPDGLIENISYIEGDAYSNTIIDSTIVGDAYYDTTFTNSTAANQYSGSEDLPLVALPFTDEQIDGWKQNAEDEEIISCSGTHVIDTSTDLGPVKITCDLEINSDPIVNLKGVVWVEGNVTIKTSPIIKLDPSYGSLSTGIIADNESNRLTSSKISIANSAVFQDSGSGDSFVMVVSQNESAENGGSEVAIEVSNTVSGDLLLYAGHGEVLLHNNINLNQITAYKAHLSNSIVVDYETGLASLIFSSGPEGGWNIIGWGEI